MSTQPVIHVCTDRYEQSHRKLPRGSGLWLFETRQGEVVVSHNGLYSKAKAAAVAWARENARFALWVCP